MEIMNQINLVVADDADDLTRRRGLAAARRTRETERTLLLRKLVRMERQGLEECLDPSRLSRLLHTRNLFPEVDDLVDPLGEPPPRRPWGR